MRDKTMGALLAVNAGALLFAAWHVVAVGAVWMTAAGMTFGWVAALLCATPVSALDALRAAGWKIRHDREYGVLSGDLLVMTWDAPGDAQYYERTVAQMPWRPAPAEPATARYEPSAKTPTTEVPNA